MGQGKVYTVERGFFVFYAWKGHQYLTQQTSNSLGKFNLPTGSKPIMCLYDLIWTEPPRTQFVAQKNSFHSIFHVPPGIPLQANINDLRVDIADAR